MKFLNEEKIWSSDVILITLLWYTHWPTSISLWNYFLSTKRTELGTALFSNQSNAQNIYGGLAANMSLQHFSLTCIYFESVIRISISLLKWFLPMKYFLGNASASQLGSKVEETGIWPSPDAILTIFFLPQ